MKAASARNTTVAFVVLILIPKVGASGEIRLKNGLTKASLNQIREYACLKSKEHPATEREVKERGCTE